MKSETIGQASKSLRERIARAVRSSGSDASALVILKKAPTRFNSTEFQSPVEPGPGSAIMIKEKLTFGCLA
jgi:hypothetical protein